MDIRKVDLNLLPVLAALLKTHSVSLAARELDMSQSALSSALARLRQLLGDELFVRTGRGMRPTARASALQQPLAAILGQLQDEVLHGTPFEPRQSERKFSLCLSDVGGYVMWPAIVRAVRKSAPKVKLELQTLPYQAIGEALENGTADLAIGAFLTLPPSLFQRRLYERDYVCQVRIGHELAGSAPTLQKFAEAPQIVVRTPSGVQEQIEESLSQHGLRRSKTLELPSYLMLRPMLESDDYLAVLPGQLADAFARHGGLVTLKLPMAPPKGVIRIHWHRRFNEDAGNVWLRQLIIRELDGR